MHKPLLGAHMSIAGGPANALLRGRSIDCDAIQMFTRNANRWDSRDLTDKEIAAFHEAREATGLAHVVAHSSYLINLGSPDEALWARSQGALATELERCRLLGIAHYVLHPGAHMGAGEEAGLQRIADGLTATLAAFGDGVTILLENTAGQGTALGYSFEQLRWLLENGPAERLGICFDTAHALAAGYDLRDAAGYAATWDAFDRTIGLERLAAIHLNDSKRDLGSRVDRHTHIGEGALGLEPFRLLVNDVRLRHIPMLLETPKNEDLAEDIMNLATLRSLVAAAPPPEG
ncbi:MAG: deoxyribonuclease IV [Chloroflexi bacterium]|jgi:deoxyribonuclease-4|nr:deoxyribonuclease IV [Chloroflexota bacterium]